MIASERVVLTTPWGGCPVFHAAPTVRFKVVPQKHRRGAVRLSASLFGGCAWEGPRHRPPPEGGWFICSGNRAIACQRTESESQSVLPERRSPDFEIRPRSPWPRHHELMLRSLVSSEAQGAKGKEGNSAKSDGTWTHTLAANALPPPSQQQPFWGAAAVVT